MKSEFGKYGFWNAQTVASNGPIKGIWYGYKRILDCLGYDYPPTIDSVQLHIGVDHETLCGGIDNLITIEGDDDDDDISDIDSVTGGHNL